MYTKKHEELRELVEEVLKLREPGGVPLGALDEALDKLQAHMDEEYYQQKPLAKDAETVLESYINDILFEPQHLVARIALWHRTLQQSFSSLCFCWIAHLASLGEYQYDGRNEASVKTAKRIKSFCDENDIYLGEMPSI